MNTTSPSCEHTRRVRELMGLVGLVFQSTVYEQCRSGWVWKFWTSWYIYIYSLAGLECSVRPVQLYSLQQMCQALEARPSEATVLFRYGTRDGWKGFRSILELEFQIWVLRNEGVAIREWCRGKWQASSAFACYLQYISANRQGRDCEQ